MKGIPFGSIMFFKGKGDFQKNFINTVVFNLFMTGIIIGANHYRVKFFNFGYLPLYANTIIMGLFAGTNSFSGGVSTYTLKGWFLFFQIGFPEFLAYIFACTATTNLTMFYAERWRGENFKKLRNFKQIKLSGQEIILLLLSLILILISAFNEWRYLRF